jgi:hypothetical protein
MSKGLFRTFYERIEHMRKKKELKQAFRRKPKPARVNLKDSDVPQDPKETRKGKL